MIYFTSPSITMQQNEREWQEGLSSFEHFLILIIGSLCVFQVPVKVSRASYNEVMDLDWNGQCFSEKYVQLIFRIINWVVC